MTFGGGKKDTEQSVQPSKPNLQAYLSQLQPQLEESQDEIPVNTSLLQSGRSRLSSQDSDFFENLDHLASISRATMNATDAKQFQENQDGDYEMELMDGQTNEPLAKTF